MWRDVCLANRDALLGELRQVRTSRRLGAASSSPTVRRSKFCGAPRPPRLDGAGRRVIAMTGRGAREPHSTSRRPPGPRAIRLPGSKSISNRTLLLAALADGETRLRGVLEADDTARMLDALRTLGVAWTRTGSGEFTVPGWAVRSRCARPSSSWAMPGRRSDRSPRPLRSPAAPTAFPACRACTSGRSATSSTRSARSARRSAISVARYQAGRRPLGDATAVRGDVSSQFLSALLMALPLAGKPVAVEVAGELVSKPYVEITLDLMRRFGVALERDGWSRFAAPAGARYRSPGRLDVEGDASSASYFLAAGAIGGGPVRVGGCRRDKHPGGCPLRRGAARDGRRGRVRSGSIEVRGRPPPARSTPI